MRHESQGGKNRGTKTDEKHGVRFSLKRIIERHAKKVETHIVSHARLTWSRKSGEEKVTTVSPFLSSLVLSSLYTFYPQTLAATTSFFLYNKKQRFVSITMGRSRKRCYTDGG